MYILSRSNIGGITNCNLQCIGERKGLKPNIAQSGPTDPQPTRPINFNLSFYKYTNILPPPPLLWKPFNFGGGWVEPREREQICKLARKTPQAAEAAGCWVEKAALWVQLNNHLACPTVFDQTSTWQVLSICSIVEPWKVLKEEKGWVWIYHEQPYPSSFLSSLSSPVNLIDNFWKILMAVLAYASGESRKTDPSRLPASAF